MFAGLNVDAYGCSEVGRVRQVNEDHFLIADLHKSCVIGTNLPLEPIPARVGSSPCPEIRLRHENSGVAVASRRSNLYGAARRQASSSRPSDAVSRG